MFDTKKDFAKDVQKIFSFLMKDYGYEIVYFDNPVAMLAQVRLKGKRDGICFSYDMRDRILDVYVVSLIDGKYTNYDANNWKSINTFFPDVKLDSSCGFWGRSIKKALIEYADLVKKYVSKN